MRLEIQRFPHNLAERFIVELQDRDFLKLKLTDWDDAFLRKCDQSTKLSGKLLALAFIARKIEEMEA